MSDRPVPAGEPGQTPGWPPQQSPTGPAGAGPGAPQPPWGPGGFQPQGPSEPDWAALAASHEQQQRKRRRLFRLGGAAVAVLVVGGIVVGAVLVTGKKSDTPQADGTRSPAASASASGSKDPAPTASGTPHGIQGPPTVGSLPATKGSIALGLGSDAKPGAVPGVQGQVLKLPSGQNSFAQTAEQVIDTSKSFTVSARVLVDVPAGNRSAVSQGDGQYYSFALGRSASDSRNLWYFKVQLPGGGSAVAYSKGDATVNQWAVLTGVYDDATRQITLYVNGVAQASAPASGIQESGTDALQVGRLSSNSQWTDPWHGAVLDIQTWGQVLPEADIVKIVAGASSPPATAPANAWLTG
ncbi:LamG domain-containing protein [Kitasatospora sp. NBC_00315]|uniref:LamG domain-containing protein n=1 Tax=Kitasatospora sp. NBC_00315 TaxID=2975963 RepID=UPI00324C1F2E